MPRSTTNHDSPYIRAVEDRYRQLPATGCRSVILHAIRQNGAPTFPPVSIRDSSFTGVTPHLQRTGIHVVGGTQVGGASTRVPGSAEDRDFYHGIPFRPADRIEF